VSPRARRLAEEQGIDLESLTGSGPGGSITFEDVERAVASGGEVVVPPAAPTASVAAPPHEADKAAERRLAMRRSIAALMARSKREIPHYYLTLDIDLQRALAWLAEENTRRSMADRLLPAALLVKATALALRDLPEFNGFWIEDHFLPGSGIHVGIAISLRGGGLVAPAIHDADQRTLGELMQGLRDLVERARAGSLHRAEMADPTITITNLGDQGVDAVHGVIYPPQVALVGFGRVREQPAAVDGLVGVRPVMTATLAADHRNSDGHRGGLLLIAIDRHLQEPENL
jgi:pyruvate dehydrogenase E2 component (dihydrolipoamide acetyltransferase)